MSEKLYPIHERFFTWQGEGVHMGKPAFFIRTFGCPVHCTFCDSAGTWHPDYIPKDVERLSAEQLTQEVVASGARICVITGGEPAIHDLRPIEDALGAYGISIHLETSGGFPIQGLIDWVTLSPKKWKPPLAENVKRANEFKFIVETPEDIMFYYDMIAKLGYNPNRLSREVPVWLHPEWSQHKNPEVLTAISEHVKKGGGVFRAGYQLHKLYQVDALDARSRPLVPLGGNPEKGF